MFRNKVIIFFTFFILLQSVCLGTNIDSLLQLLEPSRGIRKAELLNDLSETYLNTSAEKSIKHAIEALEISEDLNRNLLLRLYSPTLGGSQMRYWQL